MGLTGTLFQIASKQCPHCKKTYGKHSKKGFMKCLYTANYNLYNAVMEIQDLKGELGDVDIEKNGDIEISTDGGKDNWKKDLKSNQEVATEK